MKRATLLKYDIVKNAGKLLSANLSVQVVAFVVYPFLSRLFTPADFGLLALFLGIGDMVSRAGTLSLEEAALLPKKHKEAFALAAIGGYSTVFFALMLLLFLLFDRFVITTAEFPASFFLLPVYVLFVGLTQLFSYLFARFRLYKDISFSIAGAGASNSALRLLSGFCGLSYAALIISSILAQLTGLLVYAVQTVKKRMFRLLHLPSYNKTKKLLKQYRQFPVYVMTRNFLNSLSGNLPYFMLIGIFGNTEVGLYSMAYVVAFKPVNVFSSSVYQVLFEKFSSLKNNEKPLTPVFLGYLKIVFLLALPCFLVCGYFAQEIFGFLFGAEWRTSGRYFQIILPWIFMVLLSVPLSSIALVFSKQRFAFLIDIIYLLLRAGALGLGIALANMKTALALFSISGALIMGALLFCYLIWINRYDKNLSLNK